MVELRHIQLVNLKEVGTAALAFLVVGIAEVASLTLASLVVALAASPAVGTAVAFLVVA